MWFVPGVGNSSSNGEENASSTQTGKLDFEDFVPKDNEMTLPQLIKKVNRCLKEKPLPGKPFEFVPQGHKSNLSR